MSSYADMTDAETRLQKRALAKALAKGDSHLMALANSYAALSGVMSAIMATESRNMQSDAEARRSAIIRRLDAAQCN